MPVLVTAALAVLIQLYVSIPLQGPVAAELGSGGVTGALAAGYSLCYALGFLVYGPLSDHVGRRRVLVLGLVALTVATLGVGFAPSMSVLGLLRAVQGAAAATFAPTALAYLGESLPPRRRAAAFGAMSVAFLTAGIIGQIAATAVAAIAGWRWVFFLGSIVLAALTAAVISVVDEPDLDRPRQPLLGRYAGLIRFALRPNSLLLALGHLMVLGGFVGLYTLLGPHLAGQGLSTTQITLVRAAGLPAMFCSLAAGPLAARFGIARSAILGFLIASAGLAAGAALSASVVGSAAASVVFVGGVGILVPTMITLWGEATQPARGVGMALNGFVLFLGASLGPYATALPGGYAGSLAVLAALYLVAGLLVQFAARLSRPRR
ncbi:MFS transporter [Amycolatopsis rhizosphaerae]|uniref:MFS transporter n=1 Tax=Amycolatopsis rhizosphaerae TaxID=2053003 RepID=A0A558D549_9PSEU|nr:MFS transporter [Amycolatopsis rhizosphaerae]